MKKDTMAELTLQVLLDYITFVSYSILTLQPKAYNSYIYTTVVCRFLKKKKFTC